MVRRRIALAGLAGLLATPAFLIQPAAAAVLFSCSSVTGSAALSPGLVHDKRAQSLSSGPTAPAGPQDITLVPTSDTGVKANDSSVEGPLSADGTKVAIRSRATNLDPGDTDNLRDIYVKDLVTGDIVLASTSDTGVKSDRPSLWSSLSDAGTRVAFVSDATNLDPGATSHTDQVYVKDLATGDIVVASSSDAGVAGSGGEPALSGDGTKAAFSSQSHTLDPADTDVIYDVYAKDLATGDVTLVSTSDAGVKGNSYSRNPSPSLDGSRIAFASSATNLDPLAPNGGVFVKDLVTGDITLASSSDAGVAGSGGGASLSADGTKVAFASSATNLDPADTDAIADVYVKDLVTGDITLVSTSDAGVKGNDNSAGFGPELSGDGTKVAFSSRATNLDPADTDGFDDVYVKDLTSGDLTLASTSDTGVKGDGVVPYLSADGTRVAFATGLQMDAADTDAIVDVYVKRVPATPTSIDISGCDNGNSGTVSIVDIRSYGSRPLGCPVSLGGAPGNDYPDTTPVLVGTNSTFTIDWATGPDSYGVAAAKAGPTGTQWRFRLAITASPGHDTPATNQYLPDAGSGATKTRLQGKLGWSALDSFDCTSGTADPLSWLSLANSGTWVAKPS
jgi:Tol biopolymer transport system component